MNLLENILDTRGWSISKRLLIHAALQMLLQARMQENGQFSDLKEYFGIVAQALRKQEESPAILSMTLNTADQALKSWIQAPPDTDGEEQAMLTMWMTALHKSVSDLSEKRAKQLLVTLMPMPGTDIFFSEVLFAFCSDTFKDFSQSGMQTLDALPNLCRECIEEDGEWHDSNHFDISQLPTNKQVLMHALAPAFIGPLATENMRFSGFRQYCRAADSAYSLSRKGDPARCTKALEKANQSFTRLVSDLRQRRPEDLCESYLANDVLLTLMALLSASRQISEMQADEADNLLKAINSGEKSKNSAGQVASEMMYARLSAYSEMEETNQLDELLSTLEKPADEWKDRSVTSYMKAPNFSFRSTQPQVYYKKKIQDILNRFRFENDEYFMALVIMLHGWSQQAINYANKEDWRLNLEILDAILWETSHNILYGELGKAIKKRPDLKEELLKMLRNVVRIMAYSTNFYSPDMNSWLFINYKNFALRIAQYLDLTPLIDSASAKC